MPEQLRRFAPMLALAAMTLALFAPLLGIALAASIVLGFATFGVTRAVRHRSEHPSR